MKPWREKGWLISPRNNSAFVAQMEQVPDVYKMPYDPRYPVVCMDESPKQLIRETRLSIDMAPGREKRVDFEYGRCGVCNIFIANEPLAGKRYVEVRATKTKTDWAHFVRELADVHYKDALGIKLVMDNLNTHSASALYEVFEPQEAKRIWDRFEFIYTPKHGSWLNMAEIELNVLNGQCLARRIDNMDRVREEVGAWCEARNNMDAKIDWQFTTEDARIKLKTLYPKLNA